MYDIGITGGVVSMPEFLEKFFPQIEESKATAHGGTAYCTYSNMLLQLFTSSLFLAGLFAAFVGGYTTRQYGRKRTMLCGGVAFLVGAALTGGAVHLAMLIVGRICLGVGVGLSVQCVPLYISEIAPPKWRGGMNILFQLATTIGILVAELINYGAHGPGTSRMDNGWRISLAMAGVPAIILIIGAIVLPETPDSLMERGRESEARAALALIRGTKDVERELAEIADAARNAMAVGPCESWSALRRRENRGQLVSLVLIPFFQQISGINSIMFYAPLVFKTIGSGSDAALLSTVITGAINVAATFVSIATVDKAGRKTLLTIGGIQMAASQFAMGALLGHYFGPSGTGTIPPRAAVAVLVVVCLFVSGFAYSWGPLGWLIPSEITTLETRSAGMAICTAVNFFMSFIMGQFFLSLLCGMRDGTFYFFGAWVVAMTIFELLCLPETRGRSMDRMAEVWSAHWLWGRLFPAGPQPADVAERGSMAPGPARAIVTNGNVRRDSVVPLLNGAGSGTLGGQTNGGLSGPQLDHGAAAASKR